MDAHLLQTPLYYRQFALYLGKESLFLFRKFVACISILSLGPTNLSLSYA